MFKIIDVIPAGAGIQNSNTVILAKARIQGGAGGLDSRVKPENDIYIRHRT
ncbi:MAG TPA: hypothetical protein VMW86_05310 [Dehalococcoidales bacterium]|nr:hypothetical protein [Dehalococcoidales bacterium]